MKLFIVFLIGTTIAFSQNKISEPLGPKGEHFVLYNKCLKAITFCEITQQSYTICDAVKNCYGLYLMPGDTFYLHIEDKNQAEVITSDISFGGYFPTINNVIFQPVDNNCVPQQALQIAVPLTAVPGSSFQILTQNIAYVNNSSSQPGTPYPFNIYVGGTQPQFVFALSDFTICPYVEQVSVRELNSQTTNHILYPNPSNGTVSLLKHNTIDCRLEIYDLLGNMVFKKTEKNLKNVDISGLINGVYICKLMTDTKLLASEKLILMR